MRVLRLVVVLAFLLGSLLSFPAVLPWMVGPWIGWHTWRVARRRSAWLPLAGCAVVLLAKQPAWTAGVVAMLVVLVAVTGLHAWVRRSGSAGWGRRAAWLGAAGLWIAWAAMAIDWHTSVRCSRRVALDPARPVACLGDSLTAGMPPHGSYAEDLAARLAVPVVNLGQDGVSSSDALEKLPALAAADPQVVVVELGGHDFLKGHGRSTLAANLERIIRAARRIGAEVVLVEIPRGLIVDPYAGLERRLARRHDLELVADTPIRKLVLGSPYAPPGMWLDPSRRLSDDGLHPNRRGNRLLAEAVAGALVRLAGPEILAGATSPPIAQE